MCGIAGLVAPNRPPMIDPLVRRMMHSMARRGPDSEGLELWPAAGLGHRRLAIIDRSPAGHQPMLSEDRSVGVSFNGCIYNFLDLRAELEREGQRFRSRCDTEVLLRGYQEWGIFGLIPRLRGMFALAIWDEPNRTLSLVRDRLGVKPLVYSVQNGEIAFASTVAALNAAGFRGDVDPAAVLQFLDYGNLAGDQCIHQGIRNLGPATILQWKDGKTSEHVYWSLPEWDDNSKISFPEAVEHTEGLLVEATRLRLCADVPIAALLSGGVDSTLVCWALGRLNANVSAFTVGAPGDSSDETAQARDTAKKLGIPHQVVELPADGPETLLESECAFSEPFASASAQAMLRVSRAVKPYATVLLTGDGGDDVFLGYPFLHNAWLAQKTALRIPSWAAPSLAIAARSLPRAGGLRRLRNFLGYCTEGLSAYAAAGDSLPYFEERGILGERLNERLSRERSLPPSTVSARHLLRDVLRYQNRIHFLGEFMPKVDGGTMHYGVESRSPFLDQELWEFAAKLPPALRFHGGILKAVLREIVRKRVGPEVADRPKQGFTVPVERWLAEKWTGVLDVLTRPNEIERQGWVRPGTLAGPIAEARQRGWVPQQLWRLLLLEHWLVRESAHP